MQQPKTMTARIVSGGQDANQVSLQLALLDESGSPIDLTEYEQTGADVVLTGYTAQTAAAVLAADTVNKAIAKLEASITALAARVLALESAGDD